MKDGNNGKSPKRAKVAAQTTVRPRRHSFSETSTNSRSLTVLTNHDTIAIEWTLHRLMTASAELLAYQRHDSVTVAKNPDRQTMWLITLASFRNNLPPVVAYVKQMPAYLAMPVRDRCRLFSHAYLPLVITQLSLPSNNANSFFDNNPYHYIVFFRNFPQFQQLSQRLDEICHSFNGWRPSNVEASLLLASLFCQDTIPGLSNHSLVHNVSQRLKHVLNAVSAQYNHGDLRLRYFMHTFDLLRCAQQCAVEASSALFLNSDSNSQLPNDSLFEEMYVREHRSSSPFCSNNCESPFNSNNKDGKAADECDEQMCTNELAQFLDDK